VTAPLERKVGVPVVRCDLCGTAEPLKLSATKYGPASGEEERLRELARAGWLLTPERDLCPTCHPHEDRTPQQ
jgi:hypothetical protein